MAVRLTDELIQRLGGSALESELLAEKASALGHHGRQVEKALAALRAFDIAGGPSEERATLVIRASHEVWKFMVQRELAGLRDQREVIRIYAIPQEVLARLGAMEPHQTRRRPRG